MAKQILLTGLRPTRHLHVGNLFGALQSIVEYQEKYETYLMIADLHALTTLEETKNIHKQTIDIAMLYMACGVDPKKVTFFVQSLVPEQAELATIFSMVTPVSMLELNPVYKEMLKDHPKATNLGLLAYPVLQAADILSYRASIVPVGKDQLPHLELTREIARRFNYHYGKMFPEPESKLNKEIKILSLQDPEKKMSKSHGDVSQISLLDPPDLIHKKIKAAVTDSDTTIKFDLDKKPAISNLIQLMHFSTGKSISDIEKEHADSGYGVFKVAVADALVEVLSPIQERYMKLTKNKKAIEDMLIRSSKSAQKIAQETLGQAKNKIGLL